MTAADRPLRRLLQAAARRGDVLALVALVAAGTALALATLYALAPYLLIPADLVSFAESQYVTDIIKLRIGAPLYTPIPDNNSYLYTPGSQILTYAIGSLVGRGDSIPALRVIQFGYVVLGSLVALAASDALARRLLPPEAYRRRALWLAAWWPLLFLVATDPRFNPYVRSLHNDGLALLVSMSGFWLVTRHALAPRPWHLVAMALLPAAGFLAKQNQLMWLGLFAVYLWVEGGTPKRTVLLVAVTGAAAWGLVVAGCFALWGENFGWWIFRGLGEKQVSLARSLLNAGSAGIYAGMGLFGLLVLALRRPDRGASALWLVWALLFGIQAYTSGLGFTANHLGPGVVIATCWFLVGLVAVWPRAGAGDPDWRRLAATAATALAPLAVVAGLGVARPPRNAVPTDLARYVRDIEREFEGMNPSEVLLDNGSWIYLRHGVLVRDRAIPVSVHVGINQPRINRPALAQTIERIRERRYRRILAHALDTDHSPYDFQNRGSGVKTAILANYRIVRRIPEVRGVREWWPLNLLSEVVVLEPRPAAAPR